MSRYSVVILDDEELILQSLQTLIDWEKLGCHIVGTSKTGDKGKRLIERMHPNIVIQYIYERAFQKFELGYASALSMVLLVILAVLTLVQFKVNKGGAVND